MLISSRSPHRQLLQLTNVAAYVVYMHDMRHASMPTEREILESCACHKVRTAARAITRAYDDALRPVGLRAPQLTVLVATASDESPCQLLLSRN